MKIPRPTVGRIVWYQSYGTPKGEYKSKPRAAIVADTYDDPMVVDLVVLNPNGTFFNERCNYGSRAGQWRYPDRSEEMVEVVESKGEENDN